ncbi:MAG TPA: NAD(P)/FAD-dependent oxidoreductase [Actinomycetota bacterium]
MADVVIVGAGMAGLACALDLRAAGADVVVVEASSRPGGRVRTVTFPDGRWVEAGGEWVDTSHEHVHSLLDRYGLRTIGDGAPWWAREAGWIEDERGLRPAVDAWAADEEVVAELAWFDELIDAVAAQIADPSDPVAHPDAAAIDARSIADLFDQARLGPRARFLLDREMAFEYTCAPEEASVLFIAQQRAVTLEAEARVTDVRSQRVDGGLSRLAEAMVAELDGLVRFGEPLVRLAQDDQRVVATTTDGTVEASHAVLACPLVPLRDVEVLPAFEGAFGKGVAELGMGSVVKTFVRTSSRPPFVWAVTPRFIERLYDATEDQPGGSAILDCYVGGAGARELVRATPDGSQRVSRVRGEIAQMVPPLAAGLGDGLSQSWSEEPYIGGSFSVWNPGQVTAFWRALREPHGRVRLAGEHVSTVCGYVEGAIESGRRTAAEIVALGVMSDPLPRPVA